MDTQDKHQERISVRPEHSIRQKRPHDHTLGLRNVLNIIFMISAIIGAVLYFFTEHTRIGVYVVLGAMAVKMVECCIRMLK